MREEDVEMIAEDFTRACFAEIGSPNAVSFELMRSYFVRAVTRGYLEGLSEEDCTYAETVL